MKDFSMNVTFMDNMIAKLRELDIDMYLIITGEGADPIPLTCFGVDTVGSSAYVFTKAGDKLALASTIDAQDVEESGMFHKVERYADYYPDLAALVKRFPHEKIALNYSEDNPLCDGLTMGKHTQFLEAMGGDVFCECSSDLFIPAVQAATK